MGTEREEVNMKQLFFFLILFCIVCCSDHKQQSTLSNIPKDIYERDKAQIEDCFMRNVEYYRLHHYDESNEKAQTDPLYFYLPYAEVEVPGSVNGIMCPLNVHKYLKVTVDTILYDKRGLKCFAFLGVYTKTINKGWFITCENGKNYDARAIIGIRDRIKDSLKIVPNSYFVMLQFDTYPKAVNELKHMYFHRLKSSWLSVLFNGERKYKHNVGDENFFEKSPLFDKLDNNIYNFQSRCYKNGGCLYPYEK